MSHESKICIPPFFPSSLIFYFTQILQNKKTSACIFYSKTRTFTSRAISTCPFICISTSAATSHAAIIQKVQKVVSTNGVTILYENNDYQILKCTHRTDIYRMLLTVTVNFIPLQDNSRLKDAK
jgi:hypothetical protein